MTESSNELYVKKVYWPEIRQRVLICNPELAAVLDTIIKKYPFYLAKYQFGATIDENGEFFLPLTDGSTVSISDAKVDPETYDNLNYTLSIPVGIILSNSMELFLQYQQQHFPWIRMEPATIFALWRALDGEIAKSYHSQHAWHIKAGMRHGFLLPKISVTSSYKKLVKARVIRSKSPPRELMDHFEIFKDMSRHQAFSQSWQTEILFFSKQWLVNIKKLPALELFFYKTLAISSRFWRNKMIFDAMWDGVIGEMKKDGIVVKVHIIDIVKNIVLVALGACAGYAPAVDNLSAPIAGIQQDFLDIYGIKNAPVIMIPTRFDMYNEDASPVYWSLQFPCYLESVPGVKTRGSHLEDLNDIAYLIDYLAHHVAAKKLPVIINTPIEYCLEHVKFDFFHSDADASHPTIRPSKEMPLEDKRLVQCIVPGREDEVFEFSEVSPFVRGCVRFSLKK